MKISPRLGCHYLWRTHKLETREPIIRVVQIIGMPEKRHPDFFLVRTAKGREIVARRDELSFYSTP